MWMNNCGIKKVVVLSLALVWQPNAWAACEAGTPYGDGTIRENTPTSDFTIHGNGETVTHEVTGLMWDRCVLGQTWNATTQSCDGNAIEYTGWDTVFQAARTANANNYLGYDDWRIPNMRELYSIQETCGTAPVINEVIFPDLPEINGEANFWSSTLLVEGWAVRTLDFQRGLRPVLNFDESGFIRLIRGGRNIPVQGGDSVVIDAFDLLKSTVTSLTINPPGSSVWGEPVTLTASVQGGQGNAPSGTITFLSNGQPLVCDGGDQNLAQGQATCVLDQLPVGDYVFAASYPGDGLFYASLSGSLNYTVQQGAAALARPVPALHVWALILLSVLLGTGLATVRKFRS